MPFLSIYRRALIEPRLKYITSILSIAESATIRRNWQLIDAIGKACSINVVIDSSKDIARFYMLQQKRPEDTYMVVLVRDVYRIAASAIKWQSDPLHSANTWKQYYKILLRLIESNPELPVLFIRYEEMCQKT